ncbi:MAG: hypothetical protein H6Q65_2870 [Firmicutes bacterium]|nr:hypothetical protein [Bacillota bacterium]
MAVFLYDMMDKEWVGCSFLQVGTMAKIKRLAGERIG